MKSYQVSVRVVEVHLVTVWAASEEEAKANAVNDMSMATEDELAESFHHVENCEAIGALVVDEDDEDDEDDDGR